MTRFCSFSGVSPGSTRTAFCKVDVRHDSAVRLTLQSRLPQEPVELNIVPPAPGTDITTATPDEVAANARRLAYEDSLRAAYTASFGTTFEDSLRTAFMAAFQPECLKAEAEFVRKSEGNWREIELFIDRHPDHPYVFDYLASFSDKDLRDITASVLEEHLTSSTDYPDLPLEVYAKGIMPARISNELVRPYREELAMFKGFTADSLLRWTAENIAVDDTGNYFNCPISPAGVLRLRHADAHSRDIFIVAACRAAGIAAYLDNATNVIYIWNGTTWQPATAYTPTTTASVPAQTAPGMATLTLTYKGSSPAKPLYWPNFTLAVIEEGRLRTFDYEDDPRMASFPATLQLPAGTYCLSTGNRYPDGSVRSRLQFFTLAAGETKSVPIVIPPLLPRNEVLGTIDSRTPLFDDITLHDYAAPSTMLLIDLGPYGEPSRHLAADLRADTVRLRQWGGMTMLTAPAEAGALSWHLPNTDLSPIAPPLQQKVLKAVDSSTPTPLPSSYYPIVALIHRNGEILYLSKGYKIGTLTQALDIAARY